MFKTKQDLKFRMLRGLLTLCATLFLIAVPNPVHAAQPLEEALEQLISFSPKERLAGLTYFDANPEQVPSEHYDTLIGILDDSLRVVRNHEDGSREVTTCGSVASSILRKLGKKVLPDLSVGLVEHRSSIRWRCAKLLGNLRDPSTLDTLTGAIVEDADRLVRITAADALVELGETALPRAMELLQHPSPQVRRQAIYVSSRLGDDRIIDPLLTLAVNGDDQDAVQARQALLEMGEPIVSPLLKLVENDQINLQAKARAIGMAGRLRTFPAMEALMYIVLTHQNEKVRESALMALHADGLKGVTFHVIANLMNDPNPLIAKRIPGLMRTYPLQTLRQLFFYVRDTTPALQVYALQMIASVGIKANPLIVEALQMPGISKANRVAMAAHLKRSAFYQVPEDVRIEALILLQDWPTLAAIGPGIEPRFRSLYRSKDFRERRGALRYYGTSGNPVHYDYLIEALGDPADAVRTVAADAIFFAAAEIQDNLREHLGQGIGHKKRAVASLLRAKRYQARSEIEQLKMAASLEEWQTVTSLGDAALTYLVEMLQEDDPQVVIWAAKTLADFHSTVGLQSFNLLGLDPTLYEVMRVGGNRDNAPTVRTLEALRDRRSVGYLFCAWYCEDEETRTAAANALKKMGGAWRELLKEALKVADPDIRKETIELIGAMGTGQFDLLLPLIELPEYFDTVQEVLAANNYEPESRETRAQYLMAVAAYDQVAEIGEAGIQRLLREAFEHENKRAGVIRALARTKRPELIPQYLLYMSDANPAVAQAARYAMDQLEADINEALLKLCHGGNLTLSKNATEWLKKRGYEPETEYEKVWMAGAMQDWKLIGEMGEDFKRIARQNLLSPQENLRAISAAALAGARELNLFREIAQARQQQLGIRNRSITNNIPEVRAVAAFALREDPNKEQYIPRLFEMLTEDMDLGRTTTRLDTYRNRRTPGIQAGITLGRMGPGTYTNLMNIVGAKINPVAEQNARLGLAAMLDPIAHDQQMEFLLSDDPELAYLAANSLSHRKAREALPHLVKSSIDPDNPKRHHLKVFVMRYGDAAIPHLISAGRNNIREKANSEILGLAGLLRSEETVPFLTSYASEGKIQHRRLALEVLGRIGNERAARVLLSQTLDPLWLVRESAAGELQRLGLVAIPLLLDAMAAPELAGKGYPLRLLQRITGVDYGEDLTAWRVWWEKKSAGLKPKSPESLDTTKDTP